MLLGTKLVLQVVDGLFLSSQSLLHIGLFVHHLPDQQGQGIDLFIIWYPSIIIKELIDSHYSLIFPFGPVDL